MREENPSRRTSRHFLQTLLFVTNIFLCVTAWGFGPNCPGPIRRDVICPKPCLCCRTFLKNQVEDLRMTCVRTGITSVPRLIPVDVTYLDLGYNNISTVSRDDFAGLSNLRSLYLQSLKLLKIENHTFSGLKNLRTLNLAHNPDLDIEVNAFSGLGSSLSSLDLEGSAPNFYSENLESLASLTQLKDLTIGTLPLPYLDEQIFVNNTNLKDIHYYGMPAFVRTPNLTADITLVLVYDRFRTLDLRIPINANNLRVIYPLKAERMLLRRYLTGLRKVTNLSMQIRRSWITVINTDLFYDIAEIDALDLNFCRVRGLVVNLIQSLQTTRIRALSLRDCRISKTHLVGALFKPLRNSSLRELDLSLNYFSVIPENAFEHVPDLEILKIESAKVATIAMDAFAHLHRLKIVKLGDNKISTFSIPFILNSCPDLLDLSIEANQITYDEFFHMNHSKLEHLTLSRNRITTFVDVRHLPRLKTLYAYALNPMKLTYYLRAFDFRGNKNLEQIDIGSNNLRFTSSDNTRFVGLDKLKSLDLNRNALSLSQEGAMVSAFRNFPPSLQEIYLAENDLTELPAGLFRTLKQLRYIHLTDNKIKIIPRGFFDGLKNLMVVKLDKNVLSTLSGDSGLTSLPSLRQLSLDENSFVCDCQLRWLSNWVNRSVTIDVEGADQFCRLPENLENTTIVGYRLPWIKCDRNFEKLAGGIATATVLINLILFVLIIQYRVDIMFWWKVTRYWRNRYDVFADLADDCYDAFVSYNVNDAFFATGFMIRHLERSDDVRFRLCIDGRDFECGEFHSVNIAQKMEKSRWVILVVSKHFLTSEWCKYELHMAELKCFDERRNVIILIFLEEIDRKALPKGVVLLKKHCHSLRWPKKQKQVARFWKKLKLIMIGRNRKEQTTTTEARSEPTTFSESTRASMELAVECRNSVDDINIEALERF
ncbi:toll-like receptor 2 type-2 [Tubulanus polymorphus]|uniref:toll-like receptor 2 type-2 n=1 Tax=Tubulanus polymorphus TaxID=672921 RepID=UPI003DA4630D